MKTHSKFWGMHRILKSAHLSHRLPPPTTNIPISLVNSLRRWQASRVSCGRYWTCCLLVRGRRSIRFISLSEGEVVGSKKVLVQFLQCCFSIAATWLALRQWASSLWCSSSLLCASSSTFLHTSFSNLLHSTNFASFQAWCLRCSFASCCQSRVSVSACLLANSASITLIIGVGKVGRVEGHGSRVSS